MNQEEADQDVACYTVASYITSLVSIRFLFERVTCYCLLFVVPAGILCSRLYAPEYLVY